MLYLQCAIETTQEGRERMSMVKRVYVEKKPGFRVEAEGLLEELRDNLNLESLTSVRILHRYDLENLSESTYQRAVRRILSEAPVDDVYEEEVTLDPADFVFAVEYLPGQYDQRADSAVQCIQILEAEAKPKVNYAKVYVLAGSLSEDEKQAVKEYCINTVDSREADLAKPDTLDMHYGVPADVAIVEGFCQKSEEEIEKMRQELGLAMSQADLLHTQKYFRDTEHRDPSITEIRVLDTYWSDHCRHTTFGTVLTSVRFEDGTLLAPVRASYEDYLETRKLLGREDKPQCLMDVALAAMRRLKAEGRLTDLEESNEINACSIVLPVDVDGQEEEWLLMFKNETHNHPTEIEPFGGAATCLGGAIRDPLSGRSYVYQAMRITGGADPTVSVKDTLPGKLPQKKLAKQAAKGYSSYGNQIGLATGYVHEIYHPGFMAKHMELGAVIAAAPRANVVRGTAEPSDVVILLGGDTGRDGCGGATGSSKAHTEESIHTCGAEVQKGNPPTERKIQRLFRNPKVSRLIKVCNDFGAGGVCVAIGELADGLDIQLDLVPKKYAGLDGTELAISESQERMAVVVKQEDAAAFLAYAAEENLNAVQVAVVTESPRLVMHWRDQVIVDLSRSFIATNGAPSYAQALVTCPVEAEPSLPERASKKNFKEKVRTIMGDLSVCSQKGLVEMFDSSIGASTVLMPYGGKYQMTPIQTMVAKLPVAGETTTVSMMACGYDPYVSSWSPYHGAMYAVVESVARIIAAGGDYHKIHFTFQEYFERMGSQESWGKPLAALLGAHQAQRELGLASIGGKDSMSGSFGKMHVPPTLISLAVAAAHTQDVLTPQMKSAGNQAVYVEPVLTAEKVYDFQALMRLYDHVTEGIRKGEVLSAYAIDGGGLIEAVVKMCLGNRLGFRFQDVPEVHQVLQQAPVYGGLVLELAKGTDPASYGMSLGTVTEEAEFGLGEETISMDEVLAVYEGRLEKVYKTQVPDQTPIGDTPFCKGEHSVHIKKEGGKRPRVFIPVFPGTNCEYDTARAFRMAGAEPDVFVLRNRNAQDIRESIDEMARRIQQAQILMFSGGFSAGDEPEGSGKFIAAVFSNEKLKEATMRLLSQQDGLVLGICNGFQALIKLGLVPYGEIRELSEKDPTLTYNTIGRHASCMVRTRVVSNRSPWLMGAEPGDIHTIAISHGEGRFMADEATLARLAANGQIATQYVDMEGRPTMDIRYNPNGSLWAIEGITSPDGRVLGKMGHSERIGDQVAKNIEGNKNQKIFASGVAYFG